MKKSKNILRHSLGVVVVVVCLRVCLFVRICFLMLFLFFVCFFFVLFCFVCFFLGGVFFCLFVCLFFWRGCYFKGGGAQILYFPYVKYKKYLEFFINMMSSLRNVYFKYSE